MKRLLSGIVFTLLCAHSSPSLSARIILPPLPDDLAKHPKLFPVVEEPLLRTPEGKLLNKRVRTYPCLLIYPPSYFPCVWKFSLAEFSATGKGTGNRRLEVLSDRTVDPKDWNGTP